MKVDFNKNRNSVRGRHVSNRTKNIISQYLNGTKIQELANKYGISRQAVSEKIKLYVINNRPHFYRKHYYVCLTCGKKELYKTKKIRNLYNQKDEEIISTRSYRCDKCKKSGKIYCMTCKKTGTINSGLFTPLNKEKKSWKCKECNNKQARENIIKCIDIS